LTPTVLEPDQLGFQLLSFLLISFLQEGRITENPSKKDVAVP
jgi:hypothetical protein